MKESRWLEKVSDGYVYEWNPVLAEERDFREISHKQALEWMAKQPTPIDRNKRGERRKENSLATQIEQIRNGMDKVVDAEIIEEPSKEKAKNGEVLSGNVDMKLESPADDKFSKKYKK